MLMHIKKKLSIHKKVYSALYTFLAEFKNNQLSCIDCEKLAGRFYRKKIPLLEIYPYLVFLALPVDLIINNSVLISSIVNSDNQLVLLYKEGFFVEYFW